MSIKKIQKNQIQVFNNILSRLKKIFKIETDKKLAELINMKTSAFNLRKKSGSIPFNELLILAKNNNINLNWLFNGEGTIFLNENFKKNVKDLRHQITLLGDNDIEALNHIIKRMLKK